MPVSRDREVEDHTSRVPRCGVDTAIDDLPAFRELDGVADQVHEHLAQAAWIADERVGDVRADMPGRAPGPSARARTPSGLSRSASIAQVENGIALDARACPASIFEKSRMSFRTRSRPSAETFDHRRGTRAARPSARVSSASSVMPMMPFIGVRISWLMLARNSPLAWLAVSAACFAACSSFVRSLHQPYELALPATQAAHTMAVHADCRRR